jgi:hypothetical protein
MSLDKNWNDVADRLTSNSSPEIDTSTLAQLILDEAWRSDGKGDIEAAVKEVKSYLVTYWACNPDT